MGSKGQTVIERTAGRILKSAERMMRAGGYNGFSFREVAGDVGVKSSTVHYHFPNKEALVKAALEHYTDGFLKALGPPGDAFANAEAVLERLRIVVREALRQDRLMCLGGMLGAEIQDLPSEVAEAVRSFFSRTVGWIEEALTATSWGQAHGNVAIKRTALSVMALVEGGLILSRSMGDLEIFDQVRLDALLAHR